MTTPPLLAFDDHGSGPPIVLLHPSGFGPAVMHSFATALAADHRVLVPHRRGYGASSELPLPVSLDQHHEDLLGLLEHLVIESPVVVGVSGGATLALGLAHHARGRARLTVAHEPLVGPLAPSLHARVGARIGKLLANADQPQETSLFMSELVGVATWNRLTPTCREAVERNGAIARHEASLFAGFALDDAALDALGDEDAGRVITTVGARSSEMRQEAADVLATHGITRVDVPACAHLPIIEEPHAYAELIRSFLPSEAVTP